VRKLPHLPALSKRTFSKAALKFTLGVTITLGAEIILALNVSGVSAPELEDARRNVPKLPRLTLLEIGILEKTFEKILRIWKILVFLREVMINFHESYRM
jgi:hypothetical protein